MKQEAQYQDVIGLILPGYRADPPQSDPKSLFEQHEPKKEKQSSLGEEMTCLMYALPYCQLFQAKGRLN